jgi:hypothetical protein
MVLPSAWPLYGRLVLGQRNGWSSQVVDVAQDRGEDGTRHRHLGRLEGKRLELLSP